MRSKKYRNNHRKFMKNFRRIKKEFYDDYNYTSRYELTLNQLIIRESEWECVSTIVVLDKVAGVAMSVNESGIEYKKLLSAISEACNRIYFYLIEEDKKELLQHKDYRDLPAPKEYKFLYGGLIRWNGKIYR